MNDLSPSRQRQDGPSTPPRPPSKPFVTPNITPYTIYSHTSNDSTTDSISLSSIIPTRATHARRASASSHNLLTRSSSVGSFGLVSRRVVTTLPSPADSEGERVANDDSFDDLDPVAGRVATGASLATALANLPWAEPPPRPPSASSRVMLSGPSPIEALVSSGLPSPELPISRSSQTPTYSFLADDPATTSAIGSRRSSRASSIASAPHQTAVSAPLEPPVSEATWLAQGVPSHQRLSACSGMADATPSPLTQSSCIPEHPHAGPSGTTYAADKDSIRGLAAALKRLSQQSSRSIKSTKTARSMAKSIQSKRGSAGGMSLRYGTMRWEVDSDVLPLLQAVSEGKQGEEEMTRRLGDVRENEATMDILRLAGRAAVLERMLRAGKRVSNATIRRRRQSQQSSSAARPSHPSRTSTGRAVRGSMTSGRYSGQATPRTSQSLRKRLSRKLQRERSREDAFTELADESTFELPRGLRRNSRDVDTPTDQGRDGGVTVFKEAGPPTVPREKLRRPPELQANCMSIGCLSSAPSVNSFNHFADLEKSLGLPDHASANPPSHAEPSRREWLAQSPHLGHRPPDWRKRQSVMSHLSTGVWSVRSRRRWVLSLVVGCGILVIVIVGLLAGLLSRRT